MSVREVMNAFTRTGKFCSQGRYTVNGVCHHAPSYSVETFKYIPPHDSLKPKTILTTKGNFELIPKVITTSYMLSPCANERLLKSRERSSTYCSYFKEGNFVPSGKESERKRNVTECKPSEQFINVTNKLISNCDENKGDINHLNSNNKDRERKVIIRKDNSTERNSSKINLIRGGIINIKYIDENLFKVKSSGLSSKFNSIESKKDETKELHVNETALKQDSIILNKQLNEEVSQKVNEQVKEENVTNKNSTSSDLKEGETSNHKGQKKGKKKRKGTKGKAKKSAKSSYDNKIIPQVAVCLSLNTITNKGTDNQRHSQERKTDSNNITSALKQNTKELNPQSNDNQPEELKLLFDYSKDQQVYTKESPIKDDKNQILMQTHQQNEYQTSFLPSKNKQPDIDNNFLSSLYSSFKDTQSPYTQETSYSFSRRFNNKCCSFFKPEQANDSKSKDNIEHYFSSQTTQRNYPNQNLEQLNYNYQTDNIDLQFSNSGSKSSNQIFSQRRETSHKQLSNANQTEEGIKSSQGKERPHHMRNKTSFINVNKDEEESFNYNQDDNTFSSPYFMLTKSHPLRKVKEKEKDTPATGLFRQKVTHQKQTQSFVDNNYSNYQRDMSHHQRRDQTDNWINHSRTHMDENKHSLKITTVYHRNNKDNAFGKAYLINKEKPFAQPKAVIDTNNKDMSIKAYSLNFHYNNECIKNVPSSKSMTYEIISNQTSSTNCSYCHKNHPNHRSNTNSEAEPILRQSKPKSLTPSTSIKDIFYYKSNCKYTPLSAAAKKA